jgi:hypothetical protein
MSTVIVTGSLLSGYASTVPRPPSRRQPDRDRIGRLKTEILNQALLAAYPFQLKRVEFEFLMNMRARRFALSNTPGNDSAHAQE